jgi:flagellar motor switch protein FliM
MPAGASGLVAAVEEAAPRVGLLLGLSCGRAVGVVTTGVRRMSLVEVATPGAVWAPLSCGLPDPGLLLVPATTTVALADLAMGGTGAQAERPSTALEQRLMVQHLVPALRPLADALLEHGVTGLHAGTVSDKPLPVGGGEVVAIALDVALPSGQTASLAVCLPAKSLLPADVDPVPAQPNSATQRALADVPLEVALRLPSSTVSASEVEDLHPGDIIRLEPDSLSALVGVLTGQDEDVPVLTAALGRQGRRRAVRVGSPYGGQ